MKINTKQESATIIGADITKFGLNLKDPSIFVQMLLNLYSDPIGSSVREYVSNAYDANKDSGTDLPVVVGIEGNKFFIQDYGKGLSPDFMNSNEQGYCTIGYSTKRDSDEMIGGYGFGRLTFLSYTNQYWVHTVYQGVAYQYLIFLDGNTIKQTLLTSSPTEEPSGTRVTVQIKEGYGEKDKWVHAIRTQAAYFEGTVISIGEKKIVEVTKDGFIRKSNLLNEHTHIVLGSVYYPIPWREFSHWQFLTDMRFGIYIGLDEELTPTPSRESFVIDDFSKQLIISKFQSIAESLLVECNQIIEALPQDDVTRLKFNSEGIVGRITLKQYREVCTALNAVPAQIVDSKFYDPNLLWRYLRNYFYEDGWAQNKYYSDNWTNLKKDYAKELGADTYVTKVKKEPTYHWGLRIDVPVDCTDKDLYIRKEYKKTWDQLVEDYIDTFYIRLNESDYEVWKKNRPKAKREKGKGITYYRDVYNDSTKCTEDKGDIDFGKYPYLFKATKETANKYWNFFKSVWKTNNKFKFMITKSEGYNLDKLKPSPFLKRLCSEALKQKVYNIIGDSLQEKPTLDLIKDINPLLYQYINDIEFYNVRERHDECLEGLIEAGQLLNCFDKDEVKLKFIEHHFNKLKLMRKLGVNNGYQSDYKKQYSPEDKTLIKRFYLLERLAEKKWTEEQPVNTNQLELELC